MNPISDAKTELARIVSPVLGVDESLVLKYITYPPRREQGDLSIPLPQVSKDYRGKIEQLTRSKGNLIRRIEVAGIYLNAFLDEEALFRFLFSMDDNYGIEKAERPANFVVEHTSANPIHPLHIGHLRNSIIGDVIARMLRARGHRVNVRFYVNDTGRQVAILIYGLKKLGYPEPPQGVKKDYWLGQIYAMTNVIMEIHSLKREIDNMSEDSKERTEKLSRMDDLVGSANTLRERMPEVFDRLADAMKGEDHDAEVSKIIELYEGGNEEMKKIVRRYVGYALEGFRESLGKLHISFDVFDFESDLLWSGEVKRVISSLLSSPARFEYKGAIALNLEEYIDSLARKELSIPEGLEIPPLVLMRSDGTTLYTTRDIAYTLKKFRDVNATKVINVIAEQQMVPQIQLRASLYLAGYKREAENLVHYSYGMVNLQGMRMSGRMGKYISLDEIYDMILQMTKSKVNEKRGVVENTGEVVNSAIRYPMVSVAPNKPVSFNVNNVVNFEQNSGPYLQYTYARAFNVLSKNDEGLNESVSYEDIREEKRELLLLISKFPEVFSKACDELAPEDMVAFLKQVADIFNTWYDKERILQEQDKGKRMTRLYIVRGVETILRNGLEVLGIAPLKRM